MTFNQQLEIWKRSGVASYASIGVVPYWSVGNTDSHLYFYFNKAPADVFPRAVIDSDVTVYLLVDADQRWPLQAVPGWFTAADNFVRIGVRVPRELELVLASAHSLEARLWGTELEVESEPLAQLRAYYGRIGELRATGR